MHSDHTEKVDVYSYGIVLWEIVMRQAPYAEFGNNEMKIASAVAQHGKRPDISASTYLRFIFCSQCLSGVLTSVVVIVFCFSCVCVCSPRVSQR